MTREQDVRLIALPVNGIARMDALTVRPRSTHPDEGHVVRADELVDLATHSRAYDQPRWSAAGATVVDYFNPRARLVARLRVKRGFPGERGEVRVRARVDACAWVTKSRPRWTQRDSAGAVR